MPLYFGYSVGIRLFYCAIAISDDHSDKPKSLNYTIKQPRKTNKKEQQSEIKQCLLVCQLLTVRGELPRPFSAHLKNRILKVLHRGENMRDCRLKVGRGDIIDFRLVHEDLIPHAFNVSVTQKIVKPRM